jgi:hypothetical protein
MLPCASSSRNYLKDCITLSAHNAGNGVRFDLVGGSGVGTWGKS